MNSNEELSAIGVASPAPANPHHVSERLVETNIENAPQSSQGTQPPNETPFRPGTPPISGEHFSGGFAGSRYADVDVTDRRRPDETSRVNQLRMAGRMAQLELRAQMESADLEMRIAEANERAARARRNTKLLDVESLALEGRGGSLSTSRSSSPRIVAGSPTDSVTPAHAALQAESTFPAVHEDPDCLLHAQMAAQHDSTSLSPPSRESTSAGSGDSGNHTSRNAALRRRPDQRRAQEQREEQARTERREARSAERREERAAEREARREERREEREERRALAEQLAALHTGSRSHYRIGAAAKDFRGFEGKEDGAAYILELTHLLGTHEVPVAQWSRELNLKLKGAAATWYAARFPDLPAGTFPPWKELYAAMLLAYGQSYGAAAAYQNLHNLMRLPGSTGKEAYARVEESSMLLRRKGVINPGQEEQYAYILQNQLTVGESARWISLANADDRISDATLNALELGAADATTGRLSCPPQTREAFFAARREHLRNFLMEQGPATAGDRSVGSSSARAAVTSGGPAGVTATNAAQGQAPATTSGTPLSTPDTARVRALQVKWTARSSRDGPPPQYSRDAKVNEAIFASRIANKECFGCDMHGELVPNQPHWECKLHGMGASEASKAKRVVGSGNSSERRFYA